MEEQLELTEGLYGTTDFYTAALLICLNYEVKKITTGQPNKKVKTFHFEDSEGLRKDILDYMNSKREGNLRDFRDAIETVKDLVHS
jgi:hypothetical protein